MPRGDGTGPIGGRGPGTGRASIRRGRGRGRMGGTKAGAGPVGNCICPSCGATIPHQIGAPCYNLKCPNCSSSMVRE